MAGTTPVTTLEEFTLPPVRALDPFGDYRLTRLALISLALSVGTVFLSRFREIATIILYTQDGIQLRSYSPGLTNPGIRSHNRRAYQTEPRNEATAPTRGESV